MATRLYLPSSGAAGAAPAFGAWDETDGAVRLRCVTARKGTTQASKSASKANTAGTRQLLLQYVSDPIAAQTIPAGIAKGVLRVRESGTLDNIDRVSCRIAVVSGDGSAVRGEILPLGDYGPKNEWSTSAQARLVANGVATQGVVAQSGDRIVIEIGFKNTESGYSITGIGYFGDGAASDLPENETATTADNPWVELSADIDFSTSGTAAADGGVDVAAQPTTVAFGQAAIEIPIDVAAAALVKTFGAAAADLLVEMPNTPVPTVYGAALVDLVADVLVIGSVPGGLSLKARRAAFAEATDEVFLLLLEIDHPELSVPIRVVKNTESVASQGQTWIGVYFEERLPDDSGGLPRAEITIDNVDRAITDAIDALTSPPAVTMMVVLASDPETVEFGPIPLELKEASGDVLTVTAELGLFDSILAEPFPGHAYVPSQYPGLF